MSASYEIRNTDQYRSADTLEEAENIARRIVERGRSSHAVIVRTIPPTPGEPMAEEVLATVTLDAFGRVWTDLTAAGSALL